MCEEGPLRILISSLDAYGHVNTCLGLGSILVNRGHQVFFLNRSIYKEATEKQGIKFLDVEQFRDENNTEDKIQGNVLASNFASIDKEDFRDSLNWLVASADGGNSLLATMIKEVREFEKLAKKVIQRMDFDIFLGDFVFRVPYFSKCPIPFVPIMSFNPLLLYKGPPPHLGLSVRGDPKEWERIREEMKKHESSFTDCIEPWYREAGITITQGEDIFTPAGPLGIYVYPEVLDYKELGPHIKPSWVRMECSIRKATGDDFQIPEKLKGKPGKLIFFSLGSLGSSNLPLMRALLETFSKSPHRFIVSKGSQGDQLELPDNMWGQNFVNQLAILPQVDLVITHGGNNTLVETLAAGKPLIVMPIFGDQLDNAQRIQDLGLGKRIDPVGYNEENLLKSIEDLLTDEIVKQKIADISQRLKNSDSGEKVAQYIEKLARTRVSPLDGSDV